jgi:hypothetical protein
LRFRQRGTQRVSLTPQRLDFLSVGSRSLSLHGGSASIRAAAPSAGCAPLAAVIGWRVARLTACVINSLRCPPARALRLQSTFQPPHARLLRKQQSPRALKLRHASYSDMAQSELAIFETARELRALEIKMQFWDRRDRRWSVG